jgi:hypothetical protein
VKKVLRGADRGAQNEAVDARLEEIERKLDRLRVLYESFFMGVERVPPNVPRRELNRLVLELQQVQIANATMRFRFQTLLQRWVLLTTYWNRTMREIEAGTYRRDVNKAYRHMAKRGGAITEDEAIRLGIPANRVKNFVARQNKAVESQAAPGQTAEPDQPAATASARAPAAPPAGGGPGAGSLPGLRPGALEDFYRKYVEAHTRAAGAPPKASLEQMRAKLEKDLPRILADQRCDRIELDVAVDGTKVRLRARPVR